MLSLVLACTLAAGARAAVLPRDVAVAIFAKQSTVDDERGAIAGQCATWVRSLGAPAAIFTDVARRAPAARPGRSLIINHGVRAAPYGTVR